MPRPCLGPPGLPRHGGTVPFQREIRPIRNAGVERDDGVRDLERRCREESYLRAIRIMDLGRAVPSVDQDECGIHPTKITGQIERWWRVGTTRAQGDQRE